MSYWHSARIPAANRPTGDRAWMDAKPVGNELL